MFRSPFGTTQLFFRGPKRDLKECFVAPIFLAGIKCFVPLILENSAEMFRSPQRKKKHICLVDPV